MTRPLVQIGSDRGWLRLRWSYQGRRYALTLGLPDTKANRIAAMQRSSQIELDIISGNFDQSLGKYRSAWARQAPPPQVSLAEALKQFVGYKCDRVDQRSQERYQLLQRQVLEFFGWGASLAVTHSQAESYTQYLFDTYAHPTAREKITLVKAFYSWAIAQGLIAQNPFTDVPIPRRAPLAYAQPFTQSEVQAILAAFASSKYYRHFYPFVAVLFGTGMRLGEAVGLQWLQVSSDRTQIQISQSFGNGRIKPTKTNRDRVVRVSRMVTEILLDLGSSHFTDQDFVFQSAQGQPIDLHNFRQRAWVKILEQTAIAYRKPYSTRSTFISHALASGMNPLLVAQITGHDPQTMFRHYAGFVGSSPTAPELFDRQSLDMEILK
ncbi:MAG: tyrosine-type recombinase/integrase [Pseudanabaenaceae cyanobacterium bins.68]|nr:tyrosine-type recombinase/integrase [Pseudanabaenaceae cyanobacterium bins.68]